MLRAGASIGDRTELSAADVITALEAAVEGIKARGGADLGEKTLLDSLVPAIEQLRTSLAATDGSRTSVAEAIGEAAVAARGGGRGHPRAGRPARSGRVFRRTQHRHPWMRGPWRWP